MVRNDGQIFEVRMPFFGQMTFDASASTIDISILSAHVLGAYGVSDDDGDGILELYAIAGNDDYSFSLEAPAGTYGTYTVTTDCFSDAPTKAPTTDPTSGPTNNPTGEPTDVPTPGPTDDPTSEPTSIPTDPIIGLYAC